MKLRVKSNRCKFEGCTTALRVTDEALAIIAGYPVNDCGIEDSYELRLNNLLADYKNLLERSSFSLVDYFTAEEATVIKAAFSSTLYRSDISPKSYLIGNILDSGLAEMYGVDALSLAKKIDTLDIMQCHAIMMGVLHFWSLGTSTPEQQAILDRFTKTE